MSRDEVHGGGDWAFSKCLWSPTQKSKGGGWRYWTLLTSVRTGDAVAHLRGKGKAAAFVGYSTAAADGAETTERPPIEGKWSFAKTFFRVPLTNYVPFADPIPLQSVFSSRDGELRDYFFRNKQLTRKYKQPVFYVVQSGKLQCLNGAYFSSMDAELLGIVLGVGDGKATTVSAPVAASTQTRAQLGFLTIRIGQSGFSDEVRKNFGGKCCFPDCKIDERELLVGAHIARWADSEALRGETSNGLCFCLFHDRAFELGWFTIDADYRIVVNEAKLTSSSWAKDSISPFAGQRIAESKIKPGFASMKEHWRRTGFNF